MGFTPNQQRMTSESKPQFEWAEAEKGWRDKSGKLIPFNKLTDAQLNKYYKLASHKELMYLNKSYLFSDKRTEMEEEAEKRGIQLKKLDTTFHTNESKLSNSK